MNAEYQLTLPFIEAEATEGETRQVLDKAKAKAQVGFIPNMYAYMANAPGLLDTYLHGYEYFRYHSQFTPV